MSWLYMPLYLALLGVCFTQSFYPIFMLVAMLIRESKLFYPFFHAVDKTSMKHGGELVARVFKSHGVENIYTLPSDQVSRIVEQSHRSGIRINDVQDEATAVFEASAEARASGIPGVAVVTIGQSLTRIVTAIKDSQKTKSPVVVIACAPSNILKSSRHIQDIKQISLLKTATKKCLIVDCVRDIAPTLREAFRVVQVGIPGPVLVEISVDTLYPYSTVAERFATKNKIDSKKSQPIFISKMMDAYTNYLLNYIFADAWKTQESDPLPITVKQPGLDRLGQAANRARQTGRPLIHMLREQEHS